VSIANDFVDPSPILKAPTDYAGLAQNVRSALSSFLVAFHEAKYAGLDVQINYETLTRVTERIDARSPAPARAASDIVSIRRSF
jgi:hypothetical protein